MAHILNRNSQPLGQSVEHSLVIRNGLLSQLNSVVGVIDFFLLLFRRFSSLGLDFLVQHSQDILVDGEVLLVVVDELLEVLLVLGRK